MTRIDTMRQIVNNHEAKLVDGYWVDPTTAKMLCMVHDVLKPENQDRFDAIPLLRLVDFGWQHVKPAAKG